MVWNDDKIRRHLSFGIMHSIEAGGAEAGLGGGFGFGGGLEGGGLGVGVGDAGDAGGGIGGGGGSDLSEFDFDPGQFSAPTTSTVAPGGFDFGDISLGGVEASAGRVGGFDSFGDIDVGFDFSSPEISLGEFKSFDIDAELGLASRTGFASDVSLFAQTHPTVVSVAQAIVSAVNPFAGLALSTAIAAEVSGPKAGVTTALAGALSFGIAPAVSEIGRKAGSVAFGAISSQSKGIATAAALGAVVGTKKGAEAAIDATVGALVDNMDFNSPVGVSTIGDVSVGGGRDEARSLLSAEAGPVAQPGLRKSRSFGLLSARSDPYNYYKDILESMQDLIEEG